MADGEESAPARDVQHDTVTRHVVLDAHVVVISPGSVPRSLKRPKSKPLRSNSRAAAVVASPTTPITASHLNFRVCIVASSAAVDGASGEVSERVLPGFDSRTTFVSRAPVRIRLPYRV